MINFIKNIISKYIGCVEYQVTIVNVSGSLQKLKFRNINDLKSSINLINSERYWMVKKIEKVRKLKFEYHNKIIHTPLHFQSEITEKSKCDNYGYSFLKIDESLTNVTRTNNHIQENRDSKIEEILKNN
jgi:hypothetical protein